MSNPVDRSQVTKGFSQLLDVLSRQKCTNVQIVSDVRGTMKYTRKTSNHHKLQTCINESLD